MVIVAILWTCSLMSVLWVAKGPTLLKAENWGSDQPVLMSRQVSIFAVMQYVHANLYRMLDSGPRCLWRTMQGRNQDFWKGDSYIYEGVGVRFADFISFYLNIPWKWNNLVLPRPNYFIYIGYLKTVVGEGRGLEQTPWTTSRSATDLPDAAGSNKYRSRLPSTA